VTMDKDSITVLDLLQPNMDLLRGTIAAIVDDRVREANKTLHEPTDAIKAMVVQMQDMNNNLRSLNSTINILAERMK
jgi:hypothetical protein